MFNNTQVLYEMFILIPNGLQLEVDNHVIFRAQTPSFVSLLDIWLEVYILYS